MYYLPELMGREKRLCIRQTKIIRICLDIFHRYDYSKFTTGTDLERSKAISGAVNFIVAVDKEREREEFLKESLLLRQALSLCSSLAEEALRIEAAFFESVSVLVMRLMTICSPMLMAIFLCLIRSSLKKSER